MVDVPGSLGGAGVSQKRLLLTGGAGFIGQWMQREFQDWDITVIDIAAYGGFWGAADARDFFRAAVNAYSEGAWDACIHLAAIVGGRQTIEGSPMSLAVDLSIDAEAFNWAVRAKPRKFVYFSSSAAYPTSLQDRSFSRALHESDINLSNPKPADAIYGHVKLTGEMVARYAQETEGLDVVVVRPFSGFAHDQANVYPFPSFIERAKRRERQFEIWGTGWQERDFIHVSDICKAVRYMVDNDVPGPTNMGWGRPTTFNQLAQMVTSAAGYAPEFVHKLDAPIGVHSRVADTTYFNSFYQPKISLEQGIEQALGQLAHS
jgi:nucleoside-diphosphate-sugar epimerase